MTYLTVAQVLQLHGWLLDLHGGAAGVRDPGLLDSAVDQPKASFGGHEFYPTLAEKAAALGFSLACNHAFIDGNKRVAHAAMEVFLVLNGSELDATVDDQEATILQLAAGSLSREEFTDWVRAHLVPL